MIHAYDVKLATIVNRSRTLISSPVIDDVGHSFKCLKMQLHKLRFLQSLHFLEVSFVNDKSETFTQLFEVFPKLKFCHIPFV